MLLWSRLTLLTLRLVMEWIGIYFSLSVGAQEVLIDPGTVKPTSSADLSLNLLLIWNQLIFFFLLFHLFWPFYNRVFPPAAPYFLSTKHLLCPLWQVYFFSPGICTRSHLTCNCFGSHTITSEKTHFLTDLSSFAYLWWRSSCRLKSTDNCVYFNFPADEY